MENGVGSMIKTTLKKQNSEWPSLKTDKDYNWTTSSKHHLCIIPKQHSRGFSSLSNPQPQVQVCFLCLRLL